MKVIVVIAKRNSRFEGAKSASRRPRTPLPERVQASWLRVDHLREVRPGVQARSSYANALVLAYESLSVRHFFSCATVSLSISEQTPVAGLL